MSKIEEPIVKQRQPQKNEDFPLTPVPISSRKSIWSLAPLLIKLAGVSAYLSSGVKPINGITAAAFIYWLLGSVLPTQFNNRDHHLPQQE